MGIAVASLLLLVPLLTSGIQNACGATSSESESELVHTTNANAADRQCEGAAHTINSACILRHERLQKNVVHARSDDLQVNVNAVGEGSVKLFFQAHWILILCGLVTHVLLVSITQRLIFSERKRLAIRLQERESIARELHDTLIQSAQGLILSIQGIAGEWPKTSPMRCRMESALDRADLLLKEARDHLSDLRVICRDIELPRTLSRAAQELLVDGSAKFSVAMEGVCKPLGQNVADEIYRIGREALTNAVVHANARNIELLTSYTSEGVRIRIRDDGLGIDCKTLLLGNPGHFGLQGMRERAARIGACLEIRSIRGVGTEVDLKIAAAVAYRQEREGFPRMKAWFSLRLPRAAVLPWSEQN